MGSHLFPAVVVIAVILVVFAWLLNLYAEVVTTVCLAIVLVMALTRRQPIRRKKSRFNRSDFDDPFT